MNKKGFSISSLIVLLLLSNTAFAHPGVGEAGGFGFGFQHPFLGLDHLLVMSGLGLWLSRQNLAYRSLGIMAFLGSLLAGAALAMGGVHFAYVETVILLSVLLTGLLLVTSAWPVPGVSGLLLIVLVAFMHGQAHGSEMPVAGSVESYVFGFVRAVVRTAAATL